MARLMCIATHHKGGTIWIRRVIKALSAESGIPWIGLWTENEAGRIPHTGHAFLVNWRGWFPDALWQNDDANKLPVRIKASLVVGSLKADLDEFRGLANSLKIESK
ncbi:MAG TPA: DUF3108 domain-containing protein [Rhodobacterales bacterium]|nr:DUF3108 domain-containing protein [Rhodobacterales bacterium]